MAVPNPMIGVIEFGSRHWLPPVIVFLLCGIGLLIINVRAMRHSLPFRALLFSLKFVGMVLVALCLLSPQWVRQTIRPGENIVVLLADNSASMQIEDGEKSSRGMRMRDVLDADQGEWLTRLTQDFDLRRYQYDEGLNQFDDQAALTFTGRRSQLGAALKTISARFLNQPLGAILVMTDGNASDDDLLAELPLNVPIYPVVDQRSAKKKFDIAISQASVTESPFEDAPVTVTATVTSNTETAQPVIATLQEMTLTEQRAPLQQELTISAGGSTAVRFQLKPTETGITFYKLRVVPAAESEAFEKPETSTEVTLANNQRVLTVDRGMHRPRVLYVGGRPNWEYKFFNRALTEDREVDLVSLIRIARKEAKFDFRGRADESSNALFRGQGKEADEETESYDQAVMIRLNTHDADELSDGFPKSKQELYEYDAVILDDIEASFFSPDQQSLIDRFVSERGGGLMMLGGRDAFRHGDWQKTPVRDALPIYLDRPSDSPQGKFKWDLTRAGWLEPWMRVRSTEREEQLRLSEVPPLEILTLADQVKPGARVFAEIEDETGQQYPAVVVHPYGLGRVAAIMVGDLWRWSMQKDLAENDDLAKSWRQMVRWLVADVPRPVETELQWTQLGSVPAITLQIRLRDEEYKPRENAVVSISLLPPEGELVQLTAEPSLEEAGLFETTYVPREAGPYLAEVEVSNGSELLPQTDVIGWSSQPDAEEFREIEVNRELLTEIAQRSGGEVVEVAQLAEFVKSLPQKEMPVSQVQSTPLWHSPWILLLALSCFGAEWGLRRWRGLP